MPGRVRILWMPRGRERGPYARIAIRFAIAIGIIVVTWLVVWLERGGYTDSSDGTLDALDSLYYTTVTLTATGYGDITPVSDLARATNTLFITPLRLAFVLLLVGTTLQALTERSREQFRTSRWRSRVQNLVIVCGYGTKGRSAIRSLERRGLDRHQMVVIERQHAVAEEASRAGLVTVVGSCTDDQVFRDALVERAQSVIVAVDRDDTATLATLTVRQLNPTVPIIVSVQEEQNADLLKQSGATTVLVSADTAGRLLGIASEAPQSIEVVSDLLSYGSGLDLEEREAAPGEVGQVPTSLPYPVLAVVRGEEILCFDDPAIGVVAPGDRLVLVTGTSHRAAGR